MSEIAIQLAPDLVISANRLKKVGGEKGTPGCERKYIGEYFLGLKQGSSEALERGTALHERAEDFQATGEIAEPEDEIGVLLASGAHLVNACGKLLVEWVHAGTLPDGTEYIAYIDGHSHDGGQGHLIIIQDLKTTSNPRYALDTDPESDHYLGADLQAMLYAWILLCDKHMCAPPLPEGHFGPLHWRVWDPIERDAQQGRLRWLYFLTRDRARAWDVTAWVSPTEAAAFMQAKILPHVLTIRALHQWHSAHPTATLDDYDRNTAACSGKGRWCGPGEHKACNFDQLGTPIRDLIQLRTRPKMTPQERLANMRKGGPAATEAPKAPTAAAPAPSPEPASPAAPTTITSTAAPAASPGTTEAGAPTEAASPKPRGRAPRAPKSPVANQATGETAGVNPPSEAPAAEVVRQGTITNSFELIELVASSLPVGCSITINGTAKAA